MLRRMGAVEHTRRRPEAARLSISALAMTRDGVDDDVVPAAH